MANIFREILRDYLCRVSPLYRGACSTPQATLEQRLTQAANSRRGSAASQIVLDEPGISQDFFASQGVTGNRRITLDPNQPTQVLGKNPSRSGILISVINPGAVVFFSALESDLTQYDQTGTPTRGWFITGPNSPPFRIAHYCNDLWARTRQGASNVQIEVAEYSSPADLQNGNPQPQAAEVHQVTPQPVRGNLPKFRPIKPEHGNITVTHNPPRVIGGERELK